MAKGTQFAGEINCSTWFDLEGDELNRVLGSMMTTALKKGFEERTASAFIELGDEPEGRPLRLYLPLTDTYDGSVCFTFSLDDIMADVVEDHEDETKLLFADTLDRYSANIRASVKTVVV